LVWVLILFGLALLAGIFWLTRPLRIPREPDREGIQDGDATTAYERVSRWPLFAFGRHLVLRPLPALSQRGVLLDIGCGPGYLTAAISRKRQEGEVIGLDISPEMTTIARRDWPTDAHRNLSFVVGDVKALPIPDGSIDIVVSSLSLHHWTEAESAMLEVHRVLKPQGQLLMFDLRRDSPRLMYWVFVVGQAVFTPEPIRRTNGAVGSLWSSYTASELKDLVAKAPFRMAQVKSRPAWLLLRAVK
jgi:ubiquinone/menaquinone biosynthesis C-methylase UbiE